MYLPLSFEMIQHGDVRIRAAVYRSAPFCSVKSEDASLSVK